MCSHFGGVGNGGNSHGSSSSSSSSRKTKKQRIPKRGPGVAELEKILREQEMMMIQKDGMQKLIPSIPNNNHHISSSTSQLLGCGNGNGSKGVYIGGSGGVFLPEQTLLPITWGSKADETPKTAPPTDDHFSFPILFSNGSDHAKNFHPPTMLQNSHGPPCHPSTMNLFPMSAMSSPLSTPSSSPSAGVYHHVEPPSSQKTYSSHSCSSTLPEEHKMISTKRPRPNFPVDNWPFAHPHPHMACREPYQSSNCGVFNLGTPSRNPMQVKTSVNDHVNPSGNDIKLGSPTTPLPSAQSCRPDNISKFINQFPFQENSVGLLQRSSSEVPNQSFFNLLLAPEEQKGAAEAALGLKNEKYSTGKTGDFIDLNLKL